MKEKFGRIINRWSEGMIIALILAVVICVLPSKAAQEDVLTYTIADEQVTITDCDTTAVGEMVIPEVIGGYPVTSIGYRAFLGCSGLTSIVIPEGVTSIGTYAFSGCSGLMSIVIPEEVTSIGNYAFRDCSELTSIAIPEGVTSIRNYTFSGCSGLTNIAIPEGVTSIGIYAFSGCSGLTSIAIPEGVTSIGNNAFRNCSGLTSIAIPEGVTSIGNYTFSGCSGLRSIEIQGGVTNIGTYAFLGCSGLTSIVIPNSVTSISLGAFEKCSNLSSITLPFIGGTDDGDQYLGYIFGADSYEYNANYVPLSLKEIRILEGETDIGLNAFYGCNGLTSVTIPGSVTSIGEYAFYGCSGLTSVTIPGSVTSIREYAFYGCSGLTSIAIPEGVTSIGNYTFSGCSGLRSIEIQSGVTSIGEYAFSGCTGLTGIVIPNSVTSIGLGTFEKCNNLSSITLPFIGGTDNGNQHLGYIFGADSYEYNANCVPISLKEIRILEGETDIDSNAFYKCSGLTSVTIPGSVTSIGEYAFYGCSGLTSIEIQSGVTSIGTYAFSGCSGLTSIVIPNSVMSISLGAFEKCSNLSSITLPFIGGTDNGNQYLGYIFGADSYEYNANYVPLSLKEIRILEGETDIGLNAFYGCSGLTSVTIPGGVTSIGEYAFYGCSGLMSIVIPEGVVSIGWSAFECCNGLTSVTIPRSVTSIEEYAFYGCNRLASVTIPSGVTYIGVDAFGYCTDLVLIVHNSYAQNYAEINNISYMIGVDDLFIAELTKTKYCIGESFCDEGMLLHGKFFGENVMEITEGYKVIGFDSSVAGICAVTVEYQGYKVSFEVEICESHVYDDEQDNDCNRCAYVRTTNSIVIDTLPLKTSYCLFELFDSTGLKVKEVYSDGSEKIIESGWEISGFSSEKVGTCQVSVQYGGKKTTFDLEIHVHTFGNGLDRSCDLCGYARKIVLIDTAGITNKTIYCLDEAFDVEGFQLRLVYDYGEPGIVTSGYEVVEFDSSVTGNTTVTISYEEHLTSYDITVTGHTYSSDTEGTCDVCQKQYKDGNLTYRVEDGKIIILSCNTQASGEVVIPAVIKGRPVVGITAYAFERCMSITGILLPESVTTIGEGAFKNCYGLRKINLPTGITTIEDNTFCSCSDLVSITLPKGVKSIGNSAFKECFSLSSLNIPKTVTIIGTEAIDARFTKLYVNSAYGRYYALSNEFEWILLPDSIEVKTLPNKIQYYVGESFVADGLVIIARYYNETSEEIASNGYTVSGFDSSKVGMSTLRVEYQGQVATFEVEIISNGEPEVDLPAFKITSASLQLENDITIVFKAKAEDIDDYYSNVYAVVTQKLENGETRIETIQGVKNVAGTNYEFKYTGMTAKEVADLMDITIYGYRNGELVTGETKEDYGIMSYCLNQLNRTASSLGLSETKAAAFKTLLVDIINYASEAQIYFNYKTSTLASEQLTAEQKAMASADSVLDDMKKITNASHEIIENPSATWNAATLQLLSKATIRLKATYEGNIENVKLYAEVAGKTFEVTEYKEAGVPGVYYFYFDEITAFQFGKAVDFYFMEGNTVISDTLRYSVESYAMSKLDDATVGAVVSAMMKYGKAAQRFTETM